jgi:hypothetical protein
MNHSFNTTVAEDLGIPAAVIAENISFWVSKNAANKKHLYDGVYWTYNSVRALCELFSYLSKGKIERAICKLVEAGIVVKGNFNKIGYDRTTWYALTRHGATILAPKLLPHFPPVGNGFPATEKPIPDITTDGDSSAQPISHPDTAKTYRVEAENGTFSRFSTMMGGDTDE